MIIIKIFTNFCSSDGCIKTYIDLNKLNDDPYFNKLYKFTNDENYTHVIILNTAMPILHIPKEYVIGLAFEPPFFLSLTPTFINYAKQFISKYYIGDNTNLPNCFINHFSYMWHIPYLDYIPIKNNLISIMISNKNIAPGHKYRHIIVEHILKNNLPIDIYGNGCIRYNHLNDYRIKGEFNEKEPYESYKFHIAIENYITEDYFSEKIMNIQICSGTAIYLGAKNIDKYLDNVIKLTGNIEQDITILKEVINNQDKFYIEPNIEKVKDTLSIKNVINQFI